MMITIGESVRLDVDDETGWYPWTIRRDRRYRQVPTPVSLDGYEVRCFENQRHEGSKDHSDEMLVIRDDQWIGALTLSIRPLDKRTPPSEGLVAQWRPLKDVIFKSLFIRPPLPIQTALAELRIGLDVPDLHPRVVGENLVLSLKGPKDAYESLGRPPCIISDSLTREISGPVDELEKYTAKQFDTLKTVEDAVVMDGTACRGVLLPESEYIPQSFSRTLHVFSKTRWLTLKALYGPQSRTATIDALHRVFEALRFQEAG